MSLENISCQKSFGGWHKRYRHRSEVLGCDMVFAVYLPPQAEQGGRYTANTMSQPSTSERWR